MTRILVIEPEAACPPAHLGVWLAEVDVELDVCRPWAGDVLPDATSYDGFVLMGGSMGADDDEAHPWLTHAKEQVRRAVDAGLPTLGICLGHQLVAVALGGSVAVNPRGPQVGLFDQCWLPEAKNDRLVGDLGTVRAIQWNNDVVTELPPDAVALARTPHDELQVVRHAPRVWGVQGHPEADLEVIRSWADGDRDDHLERGIDQAALLREIDAAREELDRGWRPFAHAFARLAGAGA